MTLHTKILDAARDEVAIKHADDWEQKVSGYTHWVERYSPGENRLLAVEKKAALLAMDRQAEFFRWASMAKFTYTGDEWVNVTPQYSKDRLCIVTELELYNIWREGK